MFYVMGGGGRPGYWEGMVLSHYLGEGTSSGGLCGRTNKSQQLLHDESLIIPHCQTSVGHINTNVGQALFFFIDTYCTEVKRSNYRTGLDIYTNLSNFKDYLKKINQSLNFDKLL